LKFPERSLCFYLIFTRAAKQQDEPTPKKERSTQPARARTQACQGTLTTTLHYKIRNTCLCRSLFPCRKGPLKSSLYDFKVTKRKAITKTNLTLPLSILFSLDVLALTRLGDGGYVTIYIFSHSLFIGNLLVDALR